MNPWIRRMKTAAGLSRGSAKEVEMERKECTEKMIELRELWEDDVNRLEALLDATTKKKVAYEKVIVGQFRRMCEESLPPDAFEMLAETIIPTLEENRAMTTHSKEGR